MDFFLADDEGGWHLPELCCNCQSRRRPVKRRGFCSKCYYWQRRVEDCSAKLNILNSKPELVRDSRGEGFAAYRPSRLIYRKRVAIKVLEELKWREEGLESKAVDADRLEALVCALARDCRSKVSVNIDVLIGNMSPKSRRQIYEVLLTVVENFPSRRPNLHSVDRPIKGAYCGGGWMDWHTAHFRSKEFHDEVMLGRKLERAYYEWLQRNSTFGSQH